jgi:DNA polymerase II large subunit
MIRKGDKNYKMSKFGKMMLAQTPKEIRGHLKKMVIDAEVSSRVIVRRTPRDNNNKAE